MLILHLTKVCKGDFRDTVSLQFNKIAKTANDNTPKMTTISPNKRKRLCQNSESTEGEDVRPTEMSSDATKREDLVFVEKYRNQKQWKDELGNLL
ncbi:hypothetical protein G6F37_010668 [Rhizopus arrhizus]|nr:hypothetical protein G6F38_010206 [Rhizopus arrhizus]KAG1153092.1 hypothetical protein G6F37_010668 [Rhizopus arrhizus]